MTATRVELAANLYLFVAGQTRAKKTGCIVFASYAGQRGCQGFKVPPGTTIGYYPMLNAVVDWKEQLSSLDPNMGSQSGRAAWVVQALVRAANATIFSTHLVRHTAGTVAANPMLCKYEFAHELAYREDDEVAVPIEFYDSLLRAVDDVSDRGEEWNYHIVSVRNRVFHGGVTLQEVIATVGRSVPLVSEFLLPFAEPAVTSLGGG